MLHKIIYKIDSERKENEFLRTDNTPFVFKDFALEMLHSKRLFLELAKEHNILPSESLQDNLIPFMFDNRMEGLEEFADYAAPLYLHSFLFQHAASIRQKSFAPSVRLVVDLLKRMLPELRKVYAIRLGRFSPPENADAWEKIKQTFNNNKTPAIRYRTKFDRQQAQHKLDEVERRIAELENFKYKYPSRALEQVAGEKQRIHKEQLCWSLILEMASAFSSIFLEGGTSFDKKFIDGLIKNNQLVIIYLGIVHYTNESNESERLFLGLDSSGANHKHEARWLLKGKWPRLEMVIPVLINRDWLSSVFTVIKKEDLEPLTKDVYQIRNTSENHRFIAGTVAAYLKAFPLSYYASNSRDSFFVPYGKTKEFSVPDLNRPTSATSRASSNREVIVEAISILEQLTADRGDGTYPLDNANEIASNVVAENEAGTDSNSNDDDLPVLRAGAVISPRIQDDGSSSDGSMPDIQNPRAATSQ